MADFQRVIEFLRDVRQGGPGPGGALHSLTPEIQQMAGDYAALCIQANERLRQCSAFLQQGLRSEAIHLADESPNLLDLVAQLDLPDPQVWAEFCQNNGLPVPPPLQLERAAVLNEAYAQDQPMEHLLSRHRLLALSRAPVRERLGVMRKLAQFDSTAPYWEKDIREFERARLKELPSEFYGAVRARDGQRIAALMEEVNQQKWYETVPADLSSAVGDAYSRMQRAGAEKNLLELIEPLRDAYAARSLRECQALVQRWKSAMAAAGVTSVAPHLMDEIKPVIAFINEQTRRDDLEKRFKEACKAFTALLDADESDARLDAGYAKLKEFREEIPEDLTRRLTDIKAARRTHEDRRHKSRLMFIGGSAASVIIIGLVVAYLVMNALTAQHWADEIGRAVNLHTKQGLDQALARVSDLQKNSPGMLQEPKIAAAVSALQIQQTQFARDSQSLQDLTSRLDATQQAAAAVAAKANASMGDIRTSASGLQKIVSEAAEAAEKLSWTDPDRKLPTAMAGARSVLSSMQERVLSGVRAELAGISAGLEQLPANPSTPEAVADARSKVAVLADRLGALRDVPLLDDESTAAIAALGDKIAKRRQGADASGDIAGELQKIRTHAASAADLGAALEAFIKRFPDDPRSADFQSALKRIGPAESLDAWQQFVASFGGTPAAGNLATTQKRLDAVTGFISLHPDFPKAAEAASYADYLKKAVDALADKGAWQNAFADLLANPLYSELSYMEVSDGRRYYTLGDIKRIERSINNQVSVSFQALDVKDPIKRLPVTIDPPLTVTQAPILAPHVKVITDIGDALKLIDERNWDTFGIDLAERLTHNDTLDPVVKAILLLKALQTESAVAAWGIGDAYDKSINDLLRQTPDQLPWVDPTRISEGTRKAIKQIVEAIPSSSVVRQKLASAKTALFKSIALNAPVTGVLLRDDAGAWSLSTRAAPSDGTQVWAVVPGTPAVRTAAPSPASAAASLPATTPSLFVDALPAPMAAPGSLILVGGATGGKFTLDDGALRNAPQGSIVYITRP